MKLIILALTALTLTSCTSTQMKSIKSAWAGTPVEGAVNLGPYYFDVGNGTKVGVGLILAVEHPDGTTESIRLEEVQSK